MTSENTLKALQSMAVAAALLAGWAVFDFAHWPGRGISQITLDQYTDAANSADAFPYAKPSPFAVPAPAPRPVKRVAVLYTPANQGDFAAQPGQVDFSGQPQP